MTDDKVITKTCKEFTDELLLQIIKDVTDFCVKYVDGDRAANSKKAEELSNVFKLIQYGELELLEEGDGDYNYTAISTDGGKSWSIK
jgi:hypothetical protein